MADLTIVVSQADIDSFATGIICISFAGAAVGAGLVGLLRDLLRDLLRECWYWLRVYRRHVRVQRTEARQ